MKTGPSAVLVLLAGALAMTPYLAGPAAATADTELARAYSQYWSPLAWQSTWAGGSPLWIAGPPGLPLATAVLSRLGVTVEIVHRWIVGILYVLAAAGAYQLARGWNLPAGWVALAVAMAPSRWADLMHHGNALHTAAVAITPVALSLGWAGPPLLALFWLPLPAIGDPLPEIELAAVFVAGWIARRQNRVIPVAACTAVFAAGLAWQTIFARLDPPAPIRPATLAWLERHAPGEAAIGYPMPRPEVNPIRLQAERMISSSDDVVSSVLWVQALGVRHLVTGLGGKFATRLDAEFEDRAGWRIYQTPVRAAAEAVLVSRYEWKRLSPLSGLCDRTALSDYVAWANRPEPAGFRWTGSSQAEVRADLGPDDMILVRQNAGAGWTASADGAPIQVHADPIGYLLLDPARTGPVTIRLSAPRFRVRSPAAPLPEHAVPVISPGGIVDGVHHTPPPFSPGTIVTIYGEDLAGPKGPTRVFVGDRAADVLYAGPRQVNARLPKDLAVGSWTIAVEYGAGRSRPVRIQVVP